MNRYTYIGGLILAAFLGSLVGYASKSPVDFVGDSDRALQAMKVANIRSAECEERKKLVAPSNDPGADLCQDVVGKALNASTESLREANRKLCENYNIPCNQDQ